MAVSGHVPGTLSTDAQFDYVFSDRELEDVLLFMERAQDSTAVPAGNFSSSNGFLNHTPPSSMSLQFLPTAPTASDLFNPGAAPFPGLGLDQALNGGQSFADAFEGQPAELPFDLGVQLDNPSRQDTHDPTVKSEPRSSLEPSGLGVATDMPELPSSNSAGSLSRPEAASLSAARGASTNPALAPNCETAPLTTAFSRLGAGGLSSPTGRGARQYTAEATPPPVPPAQARRGTKQHTSHSTVEKNRRDRINSLIDELRDLVPPQSKESASTSQDNLDPAKRPKHVVLSDTILLVKNLQHKVLDVEKALRRAQSGAREDSMENGAQDLLRRSLPEGTAFSSDSTSSSGPSQELPSVPKGAPLSSGVVVEQSDGCLYVKVNCRDRRGLLSDVIMALKSYPLEITTAAVTTTADGFVYDVFQVKPPPGQECSQEDIQCHVHYALYPSSSREPQLGDKRQRVAAEEA